MSTWVRDIVILVGGLAALAVLALGGQAAVRARASGSGASQTPAPVPVVTPSGSAPAEPHYERWTVIKVVRPVVVYARPSTAAQVRTRLDRFNQNGYPNLALVDTTREVGGRLWYRVWLALRPNGTRGWIPEAEGSLALYRTAAKITIDLSERELSVTRRGQVVATFPVAIGRPGLSTPKGFFFVNQKLRPASPDGPYGVLAIGISAFQPKLPHWEQGGPVAIHGTNEPWLIGKAISHGCVRMRNKDVLQVSRYVPAGSPVEIVE